MSKVSFKVSWGLRKRTREEINVGESIPGGLPLHACSGPAIWPLLNLCHGVFLRKTGTAPVRDDGPTRGIDRILKYDLARNRRLCTSIGCERLRCSRTASPAATPDSAGTLAATAATHTSTQRGRKIDEFASDELLETHPFGLGRRQSITRLHLGSMRRNAGGPTSPSMLQSHAHFPHACSHAASPSPAVRLWPQLAASQRLPDFRDCAHREFLPYGPGHF